MSDPSVRDLLTSLRCDVNLICDSSFSAVRDVAIRMRTAIDNALSSPKAVPEPQASDPASLPTNLLLREISRRLRVQRLVPKMCSRCKKNRSRARGLCVRCYKKAYRRGEIQNARR